MGDSSYDVSAGGFHTIVPACGGTSSQVGCKPANSVVGQIGGIDHAQQAIDWYCVEGLAEINQKADCPERRLGSVDAIDGLSYQREESRGGGALRAETVLVFSQVETVGQVWQEEALEDLSRRAKQRDWAV